MARCGACGVESVAGKRFCAACGAALQSTCPSCGEPIEATDRFCSECGSDLAAAAPPAAVVASRSPGPARTPGADSRVAERRLCSVMFVDLVGFTPLSEDRDPEEVRELLSRYFDLARSVIGRYGGTVEKFIGDAVMAVWGTPVAVEGDAERAVRAALELLGAVAAMGAGDGAPPGLAARAGVVSGEVAVTIGATGEGMVAGDAVNTASRVQAAARPGTVLVDETTRRLAGLAIDFDDAGEHALKGKAIPERLWAALRVVSGFAGSQRPDGLEAPLCGRDLELRTIKDLFHASAERRAARLVEVSGPAGVGKSRLGWEFEKYIDGLADTVLWHRGRCLSYGEGVAFWALAEMVRQRLGIAEDDPSGAAADKLAEGVVRNISDPDERAYVGVRLGRLLAVPFAGDSGANLGREELFAGWRLFFERLAEVAPVIMLVEDAHHADAGMLEFLDHLVDWSRNAPIFVVVFARPELGQLRAGFGSGRNRTALWLEPLDESAMNDMLEALVPGLPGPAAAAITAQAQGVPLSAMETVRSLVDLGVVVPGGDGAYHLDGDVGELAVPESLHALLAARLDALDPPVRGLVADAAVIGTTFPAEALIAVSGRSPAEVRAALGELVRREVLEISADPLSPQRGTYRFAQDMVRQVAYGTLSRRDRRSRHLAVAANLRATFTNDGEEVMDVVARHYLDALDAVSDGDDSEEVRRTAVECLIRAAERSERSGAPSRAAASFATAAELAEQSSRRSDAATLWERAARAWVPDAESDRSELAAGHARRLYLELGDARAAARVEVIAATALRGVGRNREARQLVETALGVLRDAPDADTIDALTEMTLIDAFSGTGEVDRLSREALALAQAIDIDQSRLARLFVSDGIVHIFADRPAQAAASLREAAHLAERAGDTAMLGRARLNLSGLFVSSDPHEAIVQARAATELFRRVGHRHLLAGVAINLLYADILVGAWAEVDFEASEQAELDGIVDHYWVVAARALMAAMRGHADLAGEALGQAPALETSEDLQDRASLALVRGFMADSAGRAADALRHAKVAVAAADSVGARHECVVLAWPLAADAAHALGDRATIGELLAMVRSHPVGHLPPLLRAEAALAEARLSAAAGDPGGREALAEAIAGLRQTGSPYHLARALLDQAADLAARGDVEGAAAAGEEARRIGERLGAPLLSARAARWAPVGTEPVRSEPVGFGPR